MLNMSTSLAVKSGKTGIRTLGTVTRSPHFECGPFDHSGIFPYSSQSAKVIPYHNTLCPIAVANVIKFVLRCSAGCNFFGCTGAEMKKIGRC